MAQKTESVRMLAAIIDVDIVIQKNNEALQEGQPLMTRSSLSKELPLNKQMFINWKCGVTPNYIDSVYELLKTIEEAGKTQELLDNWTPSRFPTMIDHIIKLMKIGKCPMSEFVTKSQPA